MLDLSTNRVSELIEKAMRDNDLSVHQLANELEVSHQTVYDWKNGKGYPRHDTLGKIRSLGGWKTIFALELSLILISA